MSRLPPSLLVFSIWAAIYLPALGAFEIKGEEGRRILPAVTMMETGNYLVPRVGGAAYFSKPPLVNWLVAGSFKLFGARNEWSARVPSVLCVLAVALAFLHVARRALGERAALIASLLWLTNFGTIEKGRLIEIEALYISLCALATICWFSWREEKRSPWLTWTVPWIFLGLGWLAKGPTLLVFFYAVVLAVLWQRREWRELFHPAHFIGLVLMLAIFAAWAVPFVQSTLGARVLDKWSRQYVGRVTGEFFRFPIWLQTLPRALIYFLPWLIFVPLLRLKKFREPAQRQVANALAWSAAVPFLVINLTPGVAPRYSLPVLVPFCLLLAIAFDANAFATPEWLRTRAELWPRFGRWLVGAVAVAALLGYPLASALIFKHRPKIKNIAAEINSALPAGEVLYAIDPGYQPFFFYLTAPVRYLNTIAELPSDARYFVMRPRTRHIAEQHPRWAALRPRPLKPLTDYRHETIVLFAVNSS